ncbi:MAG: FHA domain-containing protein [Verrucomicrobiaceae bacterium]|nr:FHA domain-containing protein [Verrucomicrobiaceae bacterium]
MPKIQYTTPDGTTGEVELDQERMTVGRADDNNIVIPDGSVSSRHAEITFDGSAWTLTDTGSTNGTKVGGERVETVNLDSTGAFTLGSVECVFLGDGGGSAGRGASAVAAARSSSRSSTASSSGGSYSSQPYDRSRRTGFGPHKKEKDSSRAMLILLGVLGLAACGAAAFMAMKMGA